MEFPTTLTLWRAISMTIYYLYVKTHRITGLNYLGYTSRKDPHKYTGSGKYWYLHLQKHGYLYDTTILHRCISKSAIRAWGLFYSKLWSVVSSKKWANLKEENGDGGGCFGEINGMFGRNHTEETKKLQSLLKLGKPVEKLRGKPKSAKHCENLSKSQKGKYIGPLSCNYDHTVFVFINDNSSEEQCTKQQLTKKYNLNAGAVSAITKGKRNVHKGWRVRNRDKY